MNKLSELKKIVKELEEKTQCTCDLDKWQPERSTGHSWVCKIHRTAISKLKDSK